MAITAERRETRLIDAAQVIDNFLRLKQTPQPSDVIIALGNNDDRTAHYAGRLYLDQLAPFLLLTGNVGERTRNKTIPEARRYLNIIQSDFPEIDATKIILEDQARNTGDNIRFSCQKLLDLGICPRTILVVTKPFVERRAYESFKHQWPALDRVLVSSPGFPFQDYFLEDGVDLLYLANQLFQEISKLHTYPGQDFISPQSVPSEVDQAYREIRSLLSQTAQLPLAR
ncbi:MAG: hypothetical protein UV35_C0041G0004 [candidate division WWE3 bacterium GW2011_GWB1_42_6]|uniref:DUF218 domain-containing protein n=1 Tax=candidate division WWE3 bacterium GW2011_GWB1_42_6 TaxID=1619115 RepID=A0A0G1AWD9_UNCKA|nr:MAG: hypothetical protein UV35_C0041G0004 [candidate division WWE3 bacterium GW2011_GWB1_42_6]